VGLGLPDDRFEGGGRPRLEEGTFGGAGLTCGGSDDGGFDEFEEFCPSRASRSVSRASRYRM